MVRSYYRNHFTPISAPAPSPEFLRKLKLATASLSHRKKYLAGISGGRDSMALLHGLIALGFEKLVVCHLDHGLRGASSRADRALVKRVALKLGLPWEEERVTIKHLAKERQQSLELTAREERYAFFSRCAKVHRCVRIFVAHHADDQVETVLFNFLRGTGTAGLSGMQASSRRNGLEILRPLLEISRTEIDEYINLAHIPFRDDLSNLDTTHTRNRLRHEVLPLLRKTMGNSCDAAILRNAEIMRAEEAWLESLVPEVGDRIPVTALSSQPLALQRRMVLSWLRKQNLPEPGFQETQRVLTLLNDGTGPARVSLPGDWQARRRAGEIFLEKANP